MKFEEMIKIIEKAQHALITNCEYADEIHQSFHDLAVVRAALLNPNTIDDIKELIQNC